MAFPDTCKTPVGPAIVPMPYPNIALVMMAIPGTTAVSVTIEGFQAATTLTEVSMSQGDDAGVLGGVVSQTFIGPCKYKLGSMSVKAEGQPMCYLGSLIGQNNSMNPNAPMGIQITPSSVSVFVSPG